MKKLVLLHGWGVNSMIWQPILPELEKHFDVLVVDLPGYGSQAFAEDETGKLTLDTLTCDVSKRSPEKAIWVGWSLGGSIALSAAIDQPQRIEKLILVSSTPKFMVDESTNWNCGAQRAPLEDLANQFEQNYSKALKKFLLLQSNTSDKSRLRETRNSVRDLAQLLLTADEPTSGTLRNGLNILASTDLRAQLSSIEVETLIIAGRHDNVVPAAASKFLAESIPDSRFSLFESGHLPFLDQPERFLDELRSFAGEIN